MVGVGFGQGGGVEQELHVDRGEDRVHEQVWVGAGAEFAGRDAALDVGGGGCAAQADVVFVEVLEDGGISLAFGEEVGYDFAEEAIGLGDEVLHAKAECFFGGGGFGRVEMGGEAFVKHGEDDGGFGGPPLVEGGLADVGSFGDGIHR